METLMSLAMWVYATVLRISSRVVDRLDEPARPLPDVTGQETRGRPDPGGTAGNRDDWWPRSLGLSRLGGMSGAGSAFTLNAPSEAWSQSEEWDGDSLDEQDQRFEGAEGKAMFALKWLLMAAGVAMFCIAAGAVAYDVYLQCSSKN